MKTFTILKKLLFTIVLSFTTYAISAQCAYNNSLYMTLAAPTTVGQTITFGCSWGGDIDRVTGMQAGATYRVSTCGGGSWDSQITIYPQGGGASVGYNDDFCGLQSEIMFVPTTTGTYDILLDLYNCQSNSSCMDLFVQLMALPGVPTYCTSNATSTADSKINNVTVIGASQNINNSSVIGCATYTDFTAVPPADLVQGAQHQMSVTLGTCGGNFTKGGRVFVDFNQDIDFTDPGEAVAFFGPSSATQTYTFNIQIPFGATLGDTRMRVVGQETSNPAGIQPCGTYTWGETEDYTVTIVPPPPYDVSVQNVFPAEYTRIPISQTPFPIQAIATNIGSNTATNVIITTNVFDGTSTLVGSASSAPVTLAPGATTTFTYTGFLPNLADNYTVQHVVTMSEPETNFNNNTASFTQVISEKIYSRDDVTPVNAIGWNPGFGGSWGNTFTIVNPTVILGGQVDLGFPGFTGGPPAGSEWQMGLWSMAGGTPDTLIALTSFKTLTQGNYQQNVEFTFAQPFVIQPGEYLMSIEDPASNGPIYVTLTANIYNANEHWNNLNGAWSTMGALGFPNVPAVRMVLDNGCLVAVAGADTAICPGEPVMLGGSPSVIFGTAPFTYSWAPGSILNDPTLPNPIATPTTTTNFTLTVTDDVGCTKTDVVTITVNAPSPASLSGLNASYCAGDPIDTLTATPAGGVITGPGTTIQVNNFNSTYSGPPVPIPDASGVNANANHTPSGIPGTAVGVDVQLTQVCFQVNHTWIGDVVVELVSPNGTIVPLLDRPGSPPGFGCLGANVNICVIQGTGNPVEPVCTPPTITGTYTAHTGFDLNSLNDGSNPNGTWTLRARDLVGGDVGTIQGYTLTFSQSYVLFDPAVAGGGTHTISYCYTNDFGCETCDVHSVTVNPRPDASISNPGPLCLSTAPFNLTPGTPGGTFSGTGITDPVMGTFDASVAGTGFHTVYYEVTDINGCFNQDSTVIEVRDIPSANAGPDQTICSGGSVIIGGNPTGTPGTSSNFIVQYDWQPTAGLNSNTDPNPTASPTVTTNYTVTVTDGNGCTDTDVVTVTVNDPAIVDAGADQTICQGTTITIGGFPTASGGTPPFNYVWSPATGLTSTSSPNPDATPAATTSYTVTVTDANGCSASDVVVITVTPAPFADAGPDKNACSGAPTMIGGSPSGSVGTPPYTYSWAPAAGLNSTTASNPMATPAATTTYTLTVTDANGCTDTDVVTLNVIPSPIVNAGADVSICTGSSVTIGGFPTATSGTPPYTYLWSPSVGLNNASVQNPVATPTSTTAYTVTVTDFNGCASSDVIVVTVNNGPNAEAGPDKSICTNEPTLIGGSPSATSGTAPYTFSWSPATGLSSASVSNPMANPNASTTYTLTVTDANGCSSTDVVTITTKQAPLVDAGPDKAVCIGESVQIGGSPSGFGTGAVTFNWNPSAGLSSASDPNPIATPNVTRTYVLTVSDATGCSAKDTVVVTVNPKPNVSIAGLDSFYCVDDPIVSVTGIPAGGTFAGPGIVGSNFDPALAAPGWHTISYVYTDQNGCTNEFKFQVRVYELPVVSAGPDKTIPIGGSTTIDATGPNNVTYHWEPAAGLNDQNIKNPIASPTVTTTYTLTVEGTGGCLSDDEVTIFVDFNVAINPPNTFTPNGDNINDTWIIPMFDFFPENRVEVFNRWGQTVFERDDYSNADAWTGDDLPEGTYFFLITIDHPSQGNRVHKGTITIIR